MTDMLERAAASLWTVDDKWIETPPSFATATPFERERYLEYAKRALLAALDLTKAEAEAITLAVREKRDAHPVGDIWFDLDETLATIAVLKASITQGEQQS